VQGNAIRESGEKNKIELHEEKAQKKRRE
jgi:hypothetical protein